MSTTTQTPEAEQADRWANEAPPKRRVRHRSDAEGWLTIRVSPEHRDEYLEAVEIAARLNDSEGLSSPTDPIGRLLDAHARILIEWATENRFAYQQRLPFGPHAEAARADMEALRRDHFTCVRCKHTRANEGGTTATALVDPLMLAAGKGPQAFPNGLLVPENRITLCHPCLQEWLRIGPEGRCKAVSRILRRVGASAERASQIASVLAYGA